MIGEGDDCGSNQQPDPAVAHLHNLTLNLATLRRLMDRRDGDGALVQVDAALIGTAITAGYDEVRSVRGLLAAMPDDPTTDALNAILVVLNDLLGAMEEMLRQLED